MPNQYQATPLWETSGFKKLFGSSSPAKQSKPFYTEENFPMMTSIANGVRSYGSKLQDAILQSGVNTGKTGFHSGLQSYTAGTAPVSTDIQAPLVRQSAVQTPINAKQNAAPQNTSTVSSNGGTGSGGASGKSAKTTKNVSSVAAVLNKNNNPYDISSSQDNQLMESSLHQGGEDSALFNTPISSFVKGNSPTYNQVSVPSDALVGSGTDWAGNKIGTAYDSTGNKSSSFYDSLFSSPAAGENGWFSHGAKGLNESDAAYAARLQAPTTAMNVLNGIGTGVSALGGLYNMYQTKKNYDLEKQAQEQKMALARASEANRSAMAKAFGSTYIPAQF